MGQKEEHEARQRAARDNKQFIDAAKVKGLVEDENYNMFKGNVEGFNNRVKKDIKK